MKWIFSNDKAIDADFLSFLKDKMKLPGYLIKVFVDRGFDSTEKINQIFNVDEINLNSPFLFEDMKKAVERINVAVNKREKIVIYGDYDVDGVTAIVILM
ncbi:MAG TPA: single-stranded-DNA-specific exonuclease RecJ, partial [Candidatus Goldiibacteriota bacterium]|nr:single-stranded-DNA-specific exonuclease RecJ [Candidatus Goldiibacteriota bacterium]